MPGATDRQLESLLALAPTVRYAAISRDGDLASREAPGLANASSSESESTKRSSSTRHCFTLPGNVATSTAAAPSSLSSATATSPRPSSPFRAGMRQSRSSLAPILSTIRSG